MRAFRAQQAIVERRPRGPYFLPDGTSWRAAATARRNGGGGAGH